jgi:hypothetical protein
MTESERIRRIGHAACMGDLRNANEIKPKILKGRGHFVRTKGRGRIIIKCTLQQIREGGIDSTSSSWGL